LLSRQFSGGRPDFRVACFNAESDLGSTTRSRYKRTRLPEPSFRYRTTLAPHRTQ